MRLPAGAPSCSAENGAASPCGTPVDSSAEARAAPCSGSVLSLACRLRRSMGDAIAISERSPLALLSLREDAAQPPPHPAGPKAVSPALEGGEQHPTAGRSQPSTLSHGPAAHLGRGPKKKRAGPSPPHSASQPSLWLSPALRPPRLLLHCPCTGASSTVGRPVWQFE